MSGYAVLSLPAEGTAVIEKGAADIAVPSGPHLGEFNGPISVPELTAFLRSAAAAIVAGRFMAQRFDECVKTRMHRF